MKYIFIIAIVFGVIACAFAPWLSADQASHTLKDKAVAMVASNPNLCQLSIHEDTLHRVMFGYMEDVSFDCGVVDKTFGLAKGTENVLITFYGGIVGLSSHTVK